MAKSKYTFFVASEIAVVATDAEFADYSNPRGEIVRERFFMVAEDATGHQYRFGNEDSEFKAEVMFQHFAPPVAAWPYFRCAYGSQAYIEDNCELDLLRSEMNFDLGPDWMHNSQVPLDVRTRLY